MKPHSATVWGGTVCEHDDCDDAAVIRGLCDHHDAVETDRIVEAIWEMNRDDP